MAAIRNGEHCGRDSREIGERDRDGDYLEIETIQRIDSAIERCRD